MSSPVLKDTWALASASHVNKQASQIVHPCLRRWGGYQATFPTWILESFLLLTFSRSIPVAVLNQLKTKTGLVRLCVPYSRCQLFRFRVSPVNTLVLDNLWPGCCDWPLSRCGGASLLSGRLFCNGPDRPKEDLCPRAAPRWGRLHAHHRRPSCTYESVCARVCASVRACVCVNACLAPPASCHLSGFRLLLWVLLFFRNVGTK